MPAPPTEPPVAARAFGPLGSKLPEGPRNASNRRPTRQRAFNRAMRRLETIQTVAENRATCRVEISLELIAASLAAWPPATVPTPPMTAAVMLILKSQDRMFVFVPMVVAVCFRCVNFAAGPYRDHAARSRALLQVGFEIEVCPFI
ncbi:hypothetical protein [Mesorhizobium sp. NZP2077]|uniref:hypothetical protein n=1 Tax=Mesorhizobium sp. NZP2077 TaxID=2483404 RepID=UPI0015556576|nr:hypothetical protein [Mesorhizobium sp. NZP2077]